jgi:hypothetical protein
MAREALLLNVQAPEIVVVLETDKVITVAVVSDKVNAAPLVVPLSVTVPVVVFAIVIVPVVVSALAVCDTSVPENVTPPEPERVPELVRFVLVKVNKKVLIANVAPLSI